MASATPEKDSACFSFRKSSFLLVGFSLAVGVFFAGHHFSRVGLPRVASEIRFADGTVALLTTTFSGTLEPFIVSFYVQEPGMAWVWYYIDHQAFLGFAKASLESTGDTISISVDGVSRARYDVRKRELYRDGKLRKPLILTDGSPFEPYSQQMVARSVESRENDAEASAFCLLPRKYGPSQEVQDQN